jgi:hypothetical protein
MFSEDILAGWTLLEILGECDLEIFASGTREVIMPI